jgi:hypothetical protein
MKGLRWDFVIPVSEKEHAMYEERDTARNSWGGDLSRVMGAAIMLRFILFGLSVALRIWFMRCAAVPTDWGAVLGMQG